MRLFIINIIILGSLLGVQAAHADPQCVATDMNSLKIALTTGLDGSQPCPVVFVTQAITVTEKLDVPDNTSVIGFIANHPFQQAALNFDAQLTINDCAISLGYGANLSNLLITTTKQSQNAVCINKGNSAVIRCTIDAPFVADGFVTGIRNASSGNSILSDNAINVIKNGIIIGNSPSNITILIRNRVLTRAAGGVGISLAAPPTIMFGNELFEQATLALPKDNKFPLGTAANLIKLNNLVGSNDDGSDRSNFYELYHIFPKFLKPCDTPMGYNPYNEDGSCKTYVFGKTDAPAGCPLNQIKTTDGACGCPEGMKLDATSSLCFQEKIVEKPIEKIIEKEVIVEKPVPNITPQPAMGPMQPIVANPVGGSSGCSLTETATAASPVLAFLAIITLTGLVAYRSQPKKIRVIQKETRHD